MGKAGNANKGRGRDPHNERMRKTAHERFDQLFDAAEQGQHYGRVTIFATFKAGIVDTIGRTLDGTDKPIDA